MKEELVDVDVPAGFGPRLLAFLIDMVILSVAASLLPGTGVSRLPVDFAYFWLFTAALGRTPGKLLLRIELRTARGRMGVGTAFLREVVGKTVAFGAFGLGVLWIAFDPNKRGWHDMIAGTRAVRVQPIFYSPAWETTISTLLATSPEVRLEQLHSIPEAMRIHALHEFARRHPGEVSFQGEVLQPSGTVEWF